MQMAKWDDADLRGIWENRTMSAPTADMRAPDLRACPDAAGLKATACAHTGLVDFSDPARDEGLDALLPSMREETWDTMTGPARKLAAAYLTHHLEIRLRLSADRQAHPEIAAQKIAALLIVVAPPRSGSTLLHTLISLDLENIAPEHWLRSEPSPPLALVAPRPDRKAAAEAQMTELFAPIPYEQAIANYPIPRVGEPRKAARRRISGIGGAAADPLIFYTKSAQREPNEIRAVTPNSRGAVVVTPK